MRGSTVKKDHNATPVGIGARPSRDNSTVTRHWEIVAAMFALLAVLTSCASSNETPETASTADAATPVGGCADVMEAEIEPSGDTFRISATILSADTGWEKYADAWEVRSPDGTVLGTRVLAHPHVDEQPFTRSLNDVTIPAAVMSVEIAARDLVTGFCGDTVTVAVPR